MRYFSLNNHTYKVSFEEAVALGLAPDKGLFFPEEIPQLSQAFFDTIESLSDVEIATQVLFPFVKENISEADLKSILNEVLTFDFPLIKVTDTIYSLELFHGPTLAFKDVGARFMSRCLAYFNQKNPTEKTVLVATSGDTGGAVANGFYDVPGVKVVILYPSKRVSDIQEKQLTTLGNNIFALEVNGTFDDCQAFVKQAFLDEELKSYHLTSANSINVARWLPQMIYYFVAYKKLKSLNKKLVISCPSGNFGNICAGLLAFKMGLPIEYFIAATNANDTVPRFLSSNKYEPEETIPTISNAMDVSNPSNFVRIQALFNQDTTELKKILSSSSYSDLETKKIIKQVYESYDYITDPHGAVGFAGLKDKLNLDDIGIFLETAHPIKFSDIIESTLKIKLSIPQQIDSILNKEKNSIKIGNYDELKSYLRL